MSDLMLFRGAKRTRCLKAVVNGKRLPCTPDSPCANGVHHPDWLDAQEQARRVEKMIRTEQDRVAVTGLIRAMVRVTRLMAVRLPDAPAVYVDTGPVRHGPLGGPSTARRETRSRSMVAYGFGVVAMLIGLIAYLFGVL